MFNFTTTHVINSNYDLSTNMPLWMFNEDKKTLNIKGVNNFKSANIQKIYKASYTAPEMAKVEINFANIPTGTLKTGDTIRLSIYIRLTEADQCSYYANDTRYKGRPFTIEFPWKGDATSTLKNVLKLIKNYRLLVFDKEIVKAAYAKNSNGTEDKLKLALTAVNEFQRFHTVKLERFVDTGKPFTPEWEELTGTGLIDVKKEGCEGFGTYGQILRNIKLPTHENTTAFAPKQNEMPIPGAHYNQYTIHYAVDRGPLGLNAVGDTVKSVTTSVFYVNTALLDASVNMTQEAGATNFETALKALIGKDNLEGTSKVRSATVTNE